LVGLGAHFLPNVSVPTSEYLEHKWNLLVIKDAYAMPFFHYFRPVDGVFMCGFYNLSTINNDDVVVLDLVPAPELSWINLYVHDKVLRHLFWANLVMYQIRALSPCCGCLPLVASNPRSLLLYFPCSHCY